MTNMNTDSVSTDPLSAEDARIVTTKFKREFHTREKWNVNPDDHLKLIYQMIRFKCLTGENFFEWTVQPWNYSDLVYKIRNALTKKGYKVEMVDTSHTHSSCLIKIQW